MEIIPFKKKSVNVESFDHQAVRDMFLGDFDGLNIEESVRYVSSDYIGLDEESIAEAVAFIRQQLEYILENDTCAKYFHESLLELDNICSQNTSSASTGFGSCCVSFKTVNDNLIEIHVFQAGFVRFIKAFRIINKENVNADHFVTSS